MRAVPCQEPQSQSHGKMAKTPNPATGDAVRTAKPFSGPCVAVDGVCGEKPTHGSSHGLKTNRPVEMSRIHCPASLLNSM